MDLLSYGESQPPEMTLQPEPVFTCSTDSEIKTSSLVSHPSLSASVQCLKAALLYVEELASGDCLRRSTSSAKEEDWAEAEGTSPSNSRASEAKPATNFLMTPLVRCITDQITAKQETSKCEGSNQASSMGMGNNQGNVGDFSTIFGRAGGI